MTAPRSGLQKLTTTPSVEFVGKLKVPDRSMAKKKSLSERLSLGGITFQKENSKGLYGKLGDKTIVVPKRLNLLKYAWKTHHVNLANKHQALLHWLCNALNPKSQISSDDKPYVWNCLHEVLNTVHLLKDKLYFKPSFAQVILDELSKICEGKSGTSLTQVLACCTIILNTKGLDRLFVSQYETLIQLVAAVSQVCIKCLEKDELDPACEELFATVINLFVSNQVMKTNAIQNLQQFTSKLLLVDVNLIHLSKGSTDAISDSVSKLKEVTFEILFARDLQQYYESYLRLKTPFIENAYSPPKFIDALYAQLTSALTSTKQRKGVLHFMPEFLDAFVKNYKPGENPIGFYQFVLLSELLDIENNHDALETLCDLLKVVQGQNVYNVTADIESGDKHIGWIKALAKKLIDIHPKHRSNASWYQCFYWLLRISHSSVEGKVSALLTTCLESSQEDLSPECRQAQNDLLCQLASIYGQLRQPNKLLAAIFMSLERVSDSDFSWPSEFLTALLGTLCCPPLTSVCQLWQTLVNKVTEMSDKVCFRLAVQLLSEFLMTMPLTDSSLTPLVLKKIVDLMKETKENIILPLLKSFVKDHGNIKCSSLHLILSWEKVMFLLCQTSNIQPTLIEVLPIGNCMKTAKNETLQYLWRLILIGRVRAETLLSFQNAESSLWNIEKFVSATSSKSNENAIAWNSKILGLNDKTCITAEWDLILGHLPLILDSLNQMQLSRIAEFLSEMVSRESNGSSTSSVRAFSNTQDVALRFLGSPEFHEMTELHGMFLSSLWLRVGDSISQKDSSRPKKKRKSEQLNIFGLLSNVCSQSHQDGKLKDSLSQICLQICEMKPTTLDKDTTKAISRYLIEGIRNLPLEYLQQGDLLCCSVGILTLLGQVSSAKITELCVRILMRSMENQHFAQVLQLIDASSLIEMFVPLLYFKVEGLRKLLNKLCRQICDAPEKVDEIETIIEQLCDSVTDSDLSSSHLAEPQCFVILLKTFVKACHRNCSEKAKKTCKKYIALMSPVALKLVEKSLSVKDINGDQKLAELCMETMATLVAIRDDPKVTEGVAEKLQKVCQLSIGHLKLIGCTKACAEFVSKLCDNKDALNINEDYVNEVLTTVIDDLKQPKEDGVTDLETALDLIVILFIAKEEVLTTLQDMLSSLAAKPVENWMTSATVTLKIWRHLASKELPQKLADDFVASSQQLMRRIQEMLLTLRDYQSNAQVHELQSTAFRTQIVLLTNYGGLFPPQCTIQALHGCQYVDLSVEIEPALSLMSAVFGILNTLLLSYPNIVFSSVPSFLSATSYLLRSLIVHSHQNSVKVADLEPLLSCAQDIDRLFSLIRTNKTDFGRVVPYLIAEYVQGLQKGTVHPEIKKCLSLAVNKLISMCDQHSIALLHTTIPAGQKDIFSTLYQEYRKYYKYSGKV